MTSLFPSNKVGQASLKLENMQNGHAKGKKDHKVDIDNNAKTSNNGNANPLSPSNVGVGVLKSSFLARHAKLFAFVVGIVLALVAVGIAVGVVIGKGNNNKGGVKDKNTTIDEPTTTLEPVPVGCQCEHICTEISPDVFECSCQVGYELDTDGLSCKDIDECVNGTSGCDHTCTNTVGSYTCSCRTGSLMQPDQHTCVYDYNDVLSKSILFYDAQRSGEMPDDYRIDWRRDSAVDDHGDNGEDLSGGYYDAGDHLKLGLPMAWSAGVLTWGFIEFRDAYESAGEVENMLSVIKWFTDYFIKCHTDTNEFYVHVGSVTLDHQYWGRADDMTMERPAYKVNETYPGSDCVGDTAAAMAAASIAFRDYDSTYSDILLEEARSLYTFASNYTGKYSDSVAEAKKVYESSKYQDELTWAACWLYKATGEQYYLDEALVWFAAAPQPKSYAFGWDDTSVGHRLLLLELTGNSGTYLKYVTTKFVDNYMDNLPKTPLGLVFRNEWGSLRYASAAAFAALMTAHYGYQTTEYIDWAASQLNYALGDTGRSFVVGFGENPPERPHHRGSSCPDRPEECKFRHLNLDAPNPQPLTGALVGGPNANDEYSDDRPNYYTNEVTLDYNAGFQSAIAAIRHFQLIGLYKNVTV